MSMLDVAKAWLRGLTDRGADERRLTHAERKKNHLEAQRRAAAHLQAEERFVHNRDGIELKMFLKRGCAQAGGKAPKVMVLVPPLGQQNMLSYLPIINHFGSEYTYVSWQYRGFFSSAVPKRARRVSIRDHAEDMRDIMRAAGLNHADVVMAHSMGVQVALEFVLLYPECAEALVLMNGSYGTVFNQAFQPFFRIPFAGAFAEWLVSTLIDYDPSYITRSLRTLVQSRPVAGAMSLVARNFGSDVWRKPLGPDYLRATFGVYFGGITQNKQSSLNWLRGFQELHAHSVKHLLPSIEHPTLLLSGRLDYLTPSWVMDTMARRMPNAVHKPDWRSTHFSIIENPGYVVSEVDKFLRVNPVPDNFKRTSSVHFSKLQIKELLEDEDDEHAAAVPSQEEQKGEA